ncbi:hypothetical protein ALO_17731 [Acetonema longum DSM 6540]|uniref:Putative hemin transport system permease protein HrtB n=2 Tax=Acetonema TaxID=2373 RepID=F7NN63_9FIRM|nr:hypothetical protein ALO_17731 [Acetonema longum DSM 6540]
MHLLIAWRNLWAKSLQSLLTVAVVTSALCLTLVVMQLAAGIQNGLVRATEPFDLIVGSKGSPNQLVLNTVFLQDTPIGNIDYTIVQELRNNPLVRAAIPVGFGDNYRGYRIVGTEPAVFAHQAKPGQPSWLRVAQGQIFSAPFEAVIGVKTARETGLKIGDQFVSSHGITGGEAHADKKFTVVGILQPVQGPYDQAILVSLESLWDMHSHHDHEQEAAQEDEHGHDHEQGSVGEEGETTAILVKPQGYGEALRLYQQFQKDSRAQIVFPSQVVVQLFSALGEAEKVLSVIGYAVMAMTLLIVVFSLYWSALSRSRDRAVLRALGAGRRDLFGIILAEGVILMLGGILPGSIAGYALFNAIAGALQQKTAIVMASSFGAVEVYTIGAVLLAGILASLAPALHNARTSVAPHL